MKYGFKIYLEDGEKAHTDWMSYSEALKVKKQLKDEGYYFIGQKLLDDECTIEDANI